MARLKRPGPTEDEHICNAAPNLTAQAAIRLAASTKRARHVAEAHTCVTHTSSSIAVIQGPGVTSEMPGAAAWMCRQDSPVSQQTPLQLGRHPGCVEHNQTQSSGGPSPTHSSADADSDSTSGSSTSSTECSSSEAASSSASGEECSSGDVGGCDEEQLCSSSHDGQNGGNHGSTAAAAPATPGDVCQELARAGSSSIAATSNSPSTRVDNNGDCHGRASSHQRTSPSSSHNSSGDTSSDSSSSDDTSSSDTSSGVTSSGVTSSGDTSSGDTSNGDTSSDSCSSDNSSSDGSSSGDTSSHDTSSGKISSDHSSSDDTSSDGTSSDKTSSSGGPSSDGPSSGSDTSRRTSSEVGPSSKGNTTSCPENSVGGSNGQKHSGPSSSDNTSSSSGSSGSGSDPASDRSSSSDDTSSTSSSDSGSSDSSSDETTSSSDDSTSSGSSSGAGSSANDGLAAQPSAAVDPDWAVSGCSAGGTDDSGFAQCSSTLGDELERLQGGRRPGAATAGTAADSDAQGPEGAPLQAGATARQPPPAAALAAAPLNGCVRLLVLELCAGTCPVGEQVRLSRLIPAGRPTFEVVAYAAVEREPALAAAAPTAQSLGINDKQHLVTCGDITDEQVQQRVLRFVRKALRRQVRSGQPIQAILVAAGPPCQPYSNAVAPPSPTAPGEQRKAFRQKRRLMQVQGDKVVQAVLGVWDGIRDLVATSTAAAHDSTQAPLPDAAAAGAAAGPSSARTSAACSAASRLPCYLVLESVASTASLALRNRPCMKQRLVGHQLLRSRHHWCSYGSAHHAKKPSDVFTNIKGMPTIVPCTHGHKRHVVTVRGTLGQVSRAIWPGEFASRCLLLAAEEARQQGAACCALDG